MRKDIPVLKVEDIVVAVVPENGDPKADIWDVYLINEKDQPIKNVLVNSRGYGELEGENIKTTTLRYFFDSLDAKSFVKLEIIKGDVLSLANEYWISFNFKDYMYDKRYIFVQGSLDNENFTKVPYINQVGVMIR